MAKNLSGTYVHLTNRETSETQVVAPDEEFPSGKGWEYDESLTRRREGRADEPVASAFEFAGVDPVPTATAGVASGQKEPTVDELKQLLGEGGVEYRSDAKKAELLQLARDNGLVL